MKNKLYIFFFLLVFIGCFTVYKFKFSNTVNYIIEDGIPYFKEENDVLKIHNIKNLEEDIAVDATVYEVINNTKKKGSNK